MCKRQRLWVLLSLAAGVFQCLSDTFQLWPYREEPQAHSRGQSLPFCLTIGNLGPGQASIDPQMWDRTFLGMDRKLEDREGQVDRCGVYRAGLSWSCAHGGRGL